MQACSELRGTVKQSLRWASNTRKSSWLAWKPGGFQDEADVLRAA